MADNFLVRSTNPIPGPAIFFIKKTLPRLLISENLIMEDVDLRIQQVTESLLDNERLTADLDDEAAKVLLDWGLDRATEIVNQTGNMNEHQAYEFLGPRLKAVRRMLSATNRWISCQGHQQSELEQLEKIYRQATIVYGQIGPEEADLDPEGVTGHTWLEERGLGRFIAESSQITGDTAGMIEALRQITETYLAFEYEGAVDDSTEEQE